MIKWCLTGMPFMVLVGLVYHLGIINPVFATQDSVIQIQNEFIKIIANKGPSDLGRFSIETTTGDPLNQRDDNALLIYGRPVPWTSYTTIKVDDTPYIFGGPSKKTERRLRRSPAYGQSEIISYDASEIIAQSQLDSIRVVQRLSFLRNPITNVKDLALIEYELTNTDTVTHSVGVRLMLDTKLGDNDASPFRIGNTTITSEYQIARSEMSDYWLTFDRLSSPNIIAQGLMHSESEQLTMPDSMILSNWGTLVDSPWDFRYKEGRSFMRQGEVENDTALALYWDEQVLAPNEIRVIKTTYGLGELSISPGEITLGLTFPKELSIENESSFLVMGYVSNSGGFDALDVTVTFNLPTPFRLVKGQLTHRINRLAAGQTIQVPIQLTLTSNSTPGQYTIRMECQSQTFDANMIKRDIELTPPPMLTYTMTLTPVVSKPLYFKRYLDVDLDLFNPTNQTIHDVSVVLITKNYIRLHPSESSRKQLSAIPSQGRFKLNYRVEDTSGQPFTTISLRSNAIKTQLIRQSITYPDPALDWVISTPTADIHETDLFFISLSQQPVIRIVDAELIVLYDPLTLRFIKLLSHPGLATTPNVTSTPGKLIISDLTLASYFHGENVVKLMFEAINSGNAKLDLHTLDSKKQTQIFIKERLK